MREAEAHLIHSDTLRKWILFLSILLSGGVLLIPRVPVLLIIFALYLLMPGVKGVLDRKLLPVFVLLGVILLLTVVRPGGLDVQSLIIRYANFFAGLLLLNLYLRQEQDALAKDLYPILKWMAIQAIATVILAYTVGFLFWMIAYQDEIIQTLLFLFNYHVFQEEAGIRPDGFFWEPGVFQIYLNIYLYLALFVFKDWRQSALALVAVITTQSTTGILICIILLAGFFLYRLRYGSVRAKFSILVVGVILAIPVALIAQENITAKFTGALRGSSWARQYDLYTGVNVIAENWLIGIGFDENQYLAAARRLGYSDTPLKETTTFDRGTTNGIAYLLYSLRYSAEHLAFLFRYVQANSFSRAQGADAGALLFPCRSSAKSVIFTPFFLMITFSGLQFLSGVPAICWLGLEATESDCPVRFARRTNGMRVYGRPSFGHHRFSNLSVHLSRENSVNEVFTRHRHV